MLDRDGNVSERFTELPDGHALSGRAVEERVDNAYETGSGEGYSIGAADARDVMARSLREGVDALADLTEPQRSAVLDLIKKEQAR